MDRKGRDKVLKGADIKCRTFVCFKLSYALESYLLLPRLFLSAAASLDNLNSGPFNSSPFSRNRGVNKKTNSDDSLSPFFSFR